VLNMCDLFEDNYKEFVLGEYQQYQSTEGTYSTQTNQTYKHKTRHTVGHFRHNLSSRSIE